MVSVVKQRCVLTELVHYSSDSFFDVLNFLTPKECCKLGLSCHSIIRFTEDERVWRHYSLMYIKGFQAEKFQSLPFLKLLKSAIGFPNFKHLYVMLRSLEFSLIGSFRLMPPFSTLNLNGGLYCGRFAESKLLFHRVNTAGNTVHDGNSFFIRYVPERKALVASPCLSGPGYEKMIKLDSQINIIPIEEGQMIIDNECNSVSRSKEITILKSIPSCCSSAVSLPRCEIRMLLSCLGLFVAPYGEHGLEILHISIHQDGKNPSMQQFNNLEDNEMQIDRVDSSQGNIMLQGLKISGDPNVPAGELSFYVDMNNMVDPRAALFADQRAVVTFPPDSRSPEILSLEGRLDSMLFWARGYGQINRNPPTWDPEWVSCSYILYNTPLKNNVRFSIVWDDESDFFRHAIDFVHLPSGDCPMETDDMNI